jgi:hypothetical protein
MPSRRRRLSPDQRKRAKWSDVSPANAIRLTTSPPIIEKVTFRHITWRFNNKVRATPASRTLRVKTLAQTVVHWSVDGWRTVLDTYTGDTTLGVHVADLQTPARWRPRGLYVVLTRGRAVGGPILSSAWNDVSRFNDRRSIHDGPRARSRKVSGRESHSLSCRAG